MDNHSPPLTRREAAEYLASRFGIRRTAGTLAKYAVIGGGPPYRKARRTVLYDVADLDAWAAEITSGPVRSTSELAAANDNAPASAQEAA